ncbi:uncharacterized protein LOC134827039 [Culicoides brevitarsis]|uniref:uncharacterized protein LOC134827039 n=1 Tax=Culicoides brevitarsis TaxID=469753 RepID=UPI00307B3399
MDILKRLPLFSKCICGLSLRSGIICLAVYQLTYGLLYISITLDHHSSELSDVMDIDETQFFDDYDDRNVDEEHMKYFYIHLFYDTLVIVLALTLLYGALGRNAIAIKIYIITEFLMTIAYTMNFVVVLTVILATATTTDPVPAHLKTLILIEVVRQLISLTLTTYFLLCCNSYVQELEREARQRRTGSTVDYEPMRENDEQYNLHVI